jgi:hypothetical protein
MDFRNTGQSDSKINFLDIILKKRLKNDTRYQNF